MWDFWQEKLREVPAYDDAAGLHAEIALLAPPVWVREALHSALHTIPSLKISTPSAAPFVDSPVSAPAPAKPSPGSASGRSEDGDVLHGRQTESHIDPWFFDGGFAGSTGAAGSRKVQRWLRGAVRRRPGWSGIGQQ